MNKQEMYNKVVAHLLKQNTKSLAAESGLCMYRGANGTACAVGALIPDDRYNEGMEGYTVSALCIQFPEVESYIADMGLAIDLQRVHDINDVTLWTEKLKEVGKEHGLDTSVVDKYSA